MTTQEKAAAWAKAIAYDDSHGYDQSSRWGPDYDCSSLVITAYKQAGVPLTCTYTGNMRSDMLLHGFVPVMVDLNTGSGLQVGDVLLNEASHTAIYIGNGQIVNAGGNELGTTTGGKTGDQTGREIRVCGYYNFPWDMALRYVHKEESKPSEQAKESVKAEDHLYTVTSGDTLWSIAERTLGRGEAYWQIKQANNMSSDMIYPGQVLIIPHVDKGEITVSVTITDETYARLKIMADGWGKTIGQTIDALMEDGT
jgi:LysM repeat protein